VGTDSAITQDIAALAISGASLYDRKQPYNSEGGRTCGEQAVQACGKKPAYG